MAMVYRLSLVGSGSSRAFSWLCRFYVVKRSSDVDSF